MTELIISFKEVDNGDLVFLDGFLLCTIDYDGDFEVTKINRIRFDEIDNDIAFKEGYRHKDLLLYELESIYKDLTYDTLLYQIEFKRVG